MPTFTNQAQLYYNGTVTNSNITTGEIIEVLSAAKTSLTNTYNTGDTITYIITITNSGTVAFNNLTVTDNLGAYSFATTPEATTLYPLTYQSGTLRYFQNGVQQTTPTVTTTNGLSFSGITVPACGNVTLIYQAQVNSYAPLDVGGTITNTVTVSGENLSSDLTAQHTIRVVEKPYLTIFKSVSPLQVAENGQLTYTFEIQNLGNVATTAADNVQVRDIFSPILSNITVTYNGNVLPTSSYNYDTATGLFITQSGVLTVPAATYTQDATTGVWSTVPGTVTLTVSGTI